MSTENVILYPQNNTVEHAQVKVRNRSKFKVQNFNTHHQITNTSKGRHFFIFFFSLNKQKHTKVLSKGIHSKSPSSDISTAFFYFVRVWGGCGGGGGRGNTNLSESSTLGIATEGEDDFWVVPEAPVLPWLPGWALVGLWSLDTTGTCQIGQRLKVSSTACDIFNLFPPPHPPSNIFQFFLRYNTYCDALHCAPIQSITILFVPPMYFYIISGPHPILFNGLAITKQMAQHALWAPGIQC